MQTTPMCPYIYIYLHTHNHDGVTQKNTQTSQLQMFTKYQYEKSSGPRERLEKCQFELNGCTGFPFLFTMFSHVSSCLYNGCLLLSKSNVLALSPGALTISNPSSSSDQDSLSALPALYMIDHTCTGSGIIFFVPQWGQKKQLHSNRSLRNNLKVHL